ncbi:hypothetical protein F383_12059 [Gossypium arboreum]|uniref:Uncharacterized protein n=1 Tax=Gossypium arboreum TaxID=29729 RepID=A0A0B0N9M4_GOSAR|nr:hypothetical protein F383_06325 [Gossypium arboreum]KHG11238.1 hypothetical protein F383_12059 [Gossypium arboreum]
MPLSHTGFYSHT